MIQDRSYGIIPIYHEGNKLEFLLTQHHHGHWAFPKGHAEDGETPLAAAQREFEEETGISSYRLFQPEVTFEEHYVFQRADGMVEKTVVFYPAWVRDQRVEPQEEEVQAYGWFNYRDARDKLTFPAGKKVLREFKKYLDSSNLLDL